MRCGDCKHWGYYRAGHCNRVDSIFTDPKTSFDIVVSALDDSGLSAGLMTGPDFGCIHFLSKRKTPKP